MEDSVQKWGLRSKTMIGYLLIALVYFHFDYNIEIAWPFISPEYYDKLWTDIAALGLSLIPIGRVNAASKLTWLPAPVRTLLQGQVKNQDLKDGSLLLKEEVK